MTYQAPTQDSLRALTEGMMVEPLSTKGGTFGVSGIGYLSDLQLDQAYRNVWLARKIVDIPALDSLRKWRNWQADQNQITLIEQEERRLGLKLKLLQLKIAARLWGGAAMFIGSDQDAATELDPETIGKGGLKYLTVMGRREIVPNELEQDPLSEFYSLPSHYTVSNGKTWADIHPSRLVLQVGAPVPDPWNTTGTAWGWGDSILQAAYSTIMNVDTTAANVAALVFEANVDVFKIPELMEHMANAAYRNKLIDRFTLANAGKSITRALLTDSEEEMERKQIAFTGLPDVIQQFLIIASGAADIPLTRLLGQSPAGLNSTGEHDMKNYHDRVASIQTLEIDPATHRLNECLIRSALGSRPDEVFYTWAPLEQMSEKEQAEIAKLKAEATNVYVTTGLFTPEELREVVANQLVEDGVFPGLGDLVKANGMELPEFELEREAAKLGVEGQAVGNEATLIAAKGKATEPEPKAIGDRATLRTLYMARPVYNGEDILRHYRAQGVKGLADAADLHITIVYSKMPVDWMELGEPWEATITLPASGLRQHEAFGDDGKYLVLRVNASELQWRHEQAMDIGATHDFPEYNPHISLSAEAGGVDLATLKPWTGPIQLGPEEYDEVNP